MTKREWIKKFNATLKEMNIDENQKIFKISELDALAKAMNCERIHIMQYLRWGRI